MLGKWSQSCGSRLLKGQFTQLKVRVHIHWKIRDSTKKKWMKIAAKLLKADNVIM